MTVLCPRQISKLSRLTASPQALITAGTRIITCVSRVLHVFTTCVTRGCPWAKFWAVQNFLPRPTPFRFFSASCHVYKSTFARLKLDINANNIVCFTGDDFLTGFGRDQAVKRCVTGPLYRSVPITKAINNSNLKKSRIDLSLTGFHLSLAWWGIKMAAVGGKFS